MGKKIFAKGEILLENGDIAVEGTSILIEPNGLFKDIGPEYQEFIDNK